MKVALDTNILAYAEAIDGPERQGEIVRVLRRLPADNVIVPAQVLGELFNVLVRKGARTRQAARNAVMIWRDAFREVAGTSPDTISLALELAEDHHINIWDAVIPFAAPPHPLLDAVLGEA